MLNSFTWSSESLEKGREQLEAGEAIVSELV